MEKARSLAALRGYVGDKKVIRRKKALELCTHVSSSERNVVHWALKGPGSDTCG